MEKIKHILYKLHPVHVTALLRMFMRDESIGGKLVVAAAGLSIIIFNSPLGVPFTEFWQQHLTIGIGSTTLSMTLTEWLNEGLMAFFFLVVGLEIKREFIRGELRNHKTAILPVGAAFGGMLVPALFYLFFTAHTDATSGWGIPIATDTAIALAVLGLLGHRVPIQLKIFLLALAVTDDVGAIIIIGTFYSGGVQPLYIICSLLLILGIYLFRTYLSTRLAFVIGLGILLWLLTSLAGIHASIVGVVMGLLAPIPPKSSELSPPEKVERFLIPITTLFIVPLFALVNAGFILSLTPFREHSYVIWGIVSGLVIGKVLGIMIVALILVKTKLAQLPTDTRWRHIIGIGFIEGIGFTVSLFIAELAFGDNLHYVDAAKIGIFIGSIVSGIIGVSILLWVWRRT